MKTEHLVQTFQTLYKTKPLVVRSPGRVNIIGEHTDYKEGFVLPAAIDKAIYVAISKRKDDTIKLHAVEFKEIFSSSALTLSQGQMEWPNYILGVVDQIINSGHIRW